METRVCHAVRPQARRALPAPRAAPRGDQHHESKAGTRTIGLPDELVTLLQQHHTEQNKERAKTAELWHETGYVFTTPTGQPLNLRTDHREWKLLIARAGVAERRLHDARHIAATVSC
jgi:integrase